MEEFDYVIVGGGSAGCVLANRLSEDPSMTICLLEAGPRDRSPFIHVPLGMLRMQTHTAYNWMFASAPQQNLNDRKIFLPRGKALGGSSSINGMVYIRGHRGDYDEWAAMGNNGWAHEDVLPYFKKSENNESYGVDSLHGRGGPLNVRYPAKPNPLHRDFLASIDSLQYKRNSDFNGQHQEGFGLYQVTQKNGRRNSTAQAFLKPARRRPNLTIVTNSPASRVIIENRRATAIAVRRGGRETVYRARHEVVLAAGSFISPKLLMLSGIGSSDKLQSHGIEVHHDLPGVGMNLQDHINAGGIFMRTRSSLPYGLSVGSLPKIAWWAFQYLSIRQGLFASNVFEAGGFLRTDPALRRPDLQCFFIPAYREPPPKTLAWGHGFFINTVLMRPKSRGEVGLASPDPASAPVIDPNFFSVDDDLHTLIRGLRLARQIVRTDSFKRYDAEEFVPGDHIKSDADLGDYIRSNAQTIFHPVGTCRMGNDKLAVVDDRLRVHGIRSLRVVDASIMPTIVGGNTNAPVIMIAEKAADMIKGDQRQ